jgi:predicted metal-dependent hydrolase
MLDQAQKHKVGAKNHNHTKREKRYYYNKATTTQRKFSIKKISGVWGVLSSQK